MFAGLATFFCVFFILYLFRKDMNENKHFTKELWIPFIFMSITGSRFVSNWLNLREARSVDSYLEGSQIDSVIFGILILSSIIVLVRRRIDWGEIVRNNSLICLFLLYCLASILWSDYPVTSFKRWIKLFGTLSTTMVILTTEHPYEAFASIVRRIAFWSLPMSVLFIKYYPNIARVYHMGAPYYTGVTNQKNSLGSLCLLTGVYFIWDSIYNRREYFGLSSRRHTFINIIFFITIAWLLYMCNSVSSQISLIVAFIILLISRQPAFDGKPGKFVAVGILIFSSIVVMELSFGVKETVLNMVGRDENLTTRVPMWLYLLSIVEEPIFGAGYEVFWAGERMNQVWGETGLPVITAHNGFLDIYLSIGIIGLLLLLLCILVGSIKATEYLYKEYAYGMLRISAIVIALLCNWSESGFKPLSNILILLFIGIIQIDNSKDTNLQ